MTSTDIEAIRRLIDKAESITTPDGDDVVFRNAEIGLARAALSRIEATLKAWDAVSLKFAIMTTDRASWSGSRASFNVDAFNELGLAVDALRAARAETQKEGGA